MWGVLKVYGTCSLLIPIEEDAVLSGDLTLQKRHQILKRDIFENASFLISNYIDDMGNFPF